MILAGPRVRMEGFEFAPVEEFDPFYPGDATVDGQTRDLIAADIKRAPQYETGSSRSGWAPARRSIRPSACS